MRKVKNQKVIQKLAKKSFKANGMRNRIATLAIALTTMLFTIIFTMGLGTAETLQQQPMRQAGGDSHGVLKNLTKKQYEKLRTHPSIKEEAPRILVADRINNPEFLKRHVEAFYYPEYHYPHCFTKIIDGKAPKKADEILMDEVSMELLGLKKEAGQQVTLKMQIRQNEEEIIDRTFTVTGVTKADPALNVGFVTVSKEYLKVHEKELSYQVKETGSSTGSIYMDVNFANSRGIQEKLNKMIKESGYSVKEGAKNYISSNANWAYISDGTEKDPMTFAAAGAGLLLILLTGYLIIYNIFRISVIRDIRYYGLLKTVGTTGRQVRRILRRQAFWMALVGIPAGLLCGFFVGKALVPKIIERSAYQAAEVAVSANPLIFIGAALFSFLTVLISTRKPAKIAAKVSPVEAVRYTEGAELGTTGKRGKKKSQAERQKKSTDGGKIWRMAWSNLSRSKGRTTVTVLSLSLAIVLLNSVFTVTSSFDMDVFLKKFVTTDLQIANARYFGIDQYYGGDSEEVKTENLSESFIEACEAQDGFEEGGRIYSSTRFGLMADSWEAPDYIPHDSKGYYRTYGAEKDYLRKDENGAYSTSTVLYGLEDFPLEQIDVYEGEEDLSVIKEKLKTGKYLIYSTSTDDNGKVEPKEMMHHSGDKVTLALPDGSRREFEILTVIKENYYGLTNRYGIEFCYYTVADVFKEMESEDFLMSYLLNVEDEKETAYGQFVEDYTITKEPLMGYESKQKWLDEFSGLKNLFVLVGGTLSVVIGVIGVLNFINSVLTNIVTRRKEFAMMESIGMTKKQLLQMLILEGIYYAVITIGVVLIFGTLFSATAIRALSDGLWFMRYHFVIWPMLAACPLLLILGVAVPYLAYAPQRKNSLVEEIRRNE